MITCAGCGFENNEGSRFCGSCGAPMGGCFTPGHILQGRFRVDQVIESGPGSWVYLGYDLEGKTPVRVRQVRPPGEGFFASPSRIADYSRNIYGLSSGRIAGLVDVIFDPDSVFLVYRHREGVPLNRVPGDARNDAQFVVRVMDWLREALEILEILQGREEPLTVGTLRPSGFIITSEGLVLAETGFSFLLSRREDLAQFVRPGYAAPELFTLGRVTPASDIFSVGAVFHSLLSGINPEEQPGDIFRLEPVGKLNPSVSPAIEKVIMSMVAEDHRSRARGATTVRKKIERVLQPDSPAQKHITRGIAAYNQGKYETAADEFKSAGLLDPDDATALFWRGMTCASVEDLDGAMIYFERALTLDPDYQSAYYHRASVLMRREEYVGAVRDYTEAILRDRDDSRCYLGRAMAFNELGQTDSAGEDLEKAVELDPDYAKAHLYLGLINFDKGRLGQSLKEYDAAINSDPEDPFAYLCRGLTRGESGDPEGALSDLDMAVELHPSYDNAFLERGILLDRMGQPQQALSDLDKSISLDRENPDGYYHRGRVKYKLGDYYGAIQDLTFFISRVPGVAEAYRLRGQAYKCMGRFAEGNQDTCRYKEIKDSPA